MKQVGQKASIRVPKPRAKASGLRLFPRTTPTPWSGNAVERKRSYKKGDLQDDPTKFGNIGYDLNMMVPSLIQKRSKLGTRVV